MTKEKALESLEDFRVPVKLKIAALWTSIMFCYVYGDIFVIQEPGHIDKLTAGTVWFGGPLTQGLLLTFAIGMAIPSVMISLTLLLKPAVCRWINIIAAVLIALGPIMTMWGAWYFYTFLSSIETILTLLIVWFAWRWPRQSASP